MNRLSMVITTLLLGVNSAHADQKPIELNNKTQSEILHQVTSMIGQQKFKCRIIRERTSPFWELSGVDADGSIRFEGQTHGYKWRFSNQFSRVGINSKSEVIIKNQMHYSPCYGPNGIVGYNTEIVKLDLSTAAIEKTQELDEIIVSFSDDKTRIQKLRFLSGHIVANRDESSEAVKYSYSSDFSEENDCDAI